MLKHPPEVPALEPQLQAPRLGHSPQEVQREALILGANTGGATAEHQELQAEHQEPLEAVAAAAAAQAARAVAATTLQGTKSSIYLASLRTAPAMGASC